MALYEYICPKCGNHAIIRRPMEDRNRLAICFCGENMIRPLGLNIQPHSTRFIDEPANKYAFGFTEGERVENYKKQDALYDKTHPWRTRSQH